MSCPFSSASYNVFRALLRAVERAMKLLSSLLSVLAAEVGAVGGVHLDLLTFADEQRNLNLAPVSTVPAWYRRWNGCPADPVRYG
mgnify:CR=1 FL=1